MLHSWLIGQRRLQLRRFLRAALTALVVACALASLACPVSDDFVDEWTAQKRVMAAVEARRVKCDAAASAFVPPVPHPVREGRLRTCEGELLTGPCPFVSAPLGCLLLLVAEG